MKKFNKLTIVILFILSIFTLVACNNQSNNNKAPIARNLRIEESMLIWDAPSDQELSYELIIAYGDERKEIVVMGNKYNFSKYLEYDEVYFYLKTMPYGEFGASSEEVSISYTKPVHEHNFVNGVCECGETDPNYQPPHKHSFIDGICECGETDPNYQKPHEHNFINGVCGCGEIDPNYKVDENVKHEDGYIIKVQTNTPYIFKLEHGGSGNTLFATGYMDGYYYQTTTRVSESIVVYLEQTNGGYFVYHLKNNEKVYLDIVPSGTHINVIYTNKPGDAWIFDDKVNTLANPVDGTYYMLGTPSNKTYSTYSANKVSSASSTYIAYLFDPNDLKEDTPDKPVVPDNPVNPDDLVINNEEYYKDVLGLSGNALKLALRTLTTNTHKKNSTYADCKNELPDIDEDLNNPNNMILFYTGQSIKKSKDLNNDWNREHIWPQSLGWFKTSGAGSDLHHIRPCNISVNSSRGNKKYGYASGYYEPNDDYKGDVARIIFYLMTRYPESDNYSFNTVSEGITVLLEWNELDPVSELEMARNNKIEKFQGNRNPFIDCADFADLIW